ncbi:hypothetical protein [uncultured Brachybacterium sp.]|uniref:hypothetical protein n=1 Tax=uncultured Brachybacterium sp. TaxID=189680 RepID=UPI0026241CA0|nr:hypothetical protein [uncultured Brachybacterium sp.]
MPRRSWRDLTPGPGPVESAGVGHSPPAAPAPTSPELLHQAAAGDSRLAGLLAERERLESQLSGLTSPAGAAAAAADARYPVTGLRERRAEIASWADARDALAAVRAGAASLGGVRPRGGTAPSASGPGALTGAGSDLRSQLSGPLRSGLGRYDQVRSALDRSDEFLTRPQQLADGLARRRQQAQELMAGPLDRVGSYAETRDRVLDTDSGGSGDLFARAEAARRRALERRSALDREEQRAAERHEGRHALRHEQGRAQRREQRREERRAEQQDTERLDRRSTTASSRAEKGV